MSSHHPAPPEANLVKALRWICIIAAIVAGVGFVGIVLSQAMTGTVDWLWFKLMLSACAVSAIGLLVHDRLANKWHRYK